MLFHSAVTGKKPFAKGLYALFHRNPLPTTRKIQRPMSSADTVSTTMPSETGGSRQPVVDFDASSSPFLYAIDDLKAAFARPKLVWTLTRASFFARYRGTLIGPFWQTLVTGMTVTGLALLYGQILNVAVSSYFPYVASGIIVWGLISTIINDGASIFLVSSGFFTQSPIAKSLFALRSIGSAALAFAFKSLVLVPVIIFSGLRIGPGDILLSIAGLALIFWTGFWITLGLGAIGARFRDVGQLTNAALTFAFFVTPVFWQASRLGDYYFIAALNPFTHFLNIVRGPLIGAPDIASSFLWAGLAALIATIFGAVIFGKFARRLCYWS